MAFMLRSAALIGYASLARSLGLDPERLIAAAGLPREALNRPDLRVPALCVARLLELSATTARAEDFGLRLGETRRLIDLGLMAAVAREAPTPRVAVNIVGRYLRLHNEVLSLQLDRSDGDWFVSPMLAVAAYQPMRQAVELSVVVLHRALAEIFGADWQPALVCFAHPSPRDPSRHRRLFGTRVEFGAAATGLICPEAVMERRRLVAESLLSLEARATLDERLGQAPIETATEARETIAWLLPTGLCSTEAVAARLGLGLRTLHRRLAREGAGYTALIDDVRHGLAARYLLEGWPLKTMAPALGFESSSAFSRWFRKHFGCNPTEWRRHAGRLATRR